MVYPIKRIMRALMCVALASVSPTTLFAQRMEVLEPGTRVRVVVPGVADSSVVGNVEFHTAETLMLMPQGRRAQRIAIPNTAIERLEVSQGRTSRGYHVVLGSLLGTGLGALGGYGAASLSGCSGVACGAGDAVGAIGGGLLGLLIGASLGAEVKPRPERWEERPLRYTERTSLSISVPLP